VTGPLAGGLVGGLAGLGLVMIARQVSLARRTDFGMRVLHHLSDVPELARPGHPGRTGAASLRAIADRLDHLLGGNQSVRRRLERASLDMTVADFRLQQVWWGLAAMGLMGVLTVLVTLRSPDRLLPMVVLTVVVGLLGVLLRENRLTAQVRAHERAVLAELPALTELLALAVAAGEGPVAALERVAGRSSGAFSRELGQVLGVIRTGTPVSVALDDYSARTGVPVVSRFSQALAVALERGTPLADVLHAQAADVREARRRQLIETGARREVAMMVPVVFLVLPTTVMFAFWPGIVGLRLVTP
jgi:tight adherence protein C